MMSPERKRERLPPALRAGLAGWVAAGWSDRRIARRFGVAPWRVTCARVRAGLPNHRGWPIGAADLRDLLDEGWTDGEIGAEFAVPARAVERERLKLGLRRSNDPRPAARRRVIPVAPSSSPANALVTAGTALDRACRVLGGRLVRTADGLFRLDGRLVSVVRVLDAAGERRW